ncbi:MAG TPA: extracellular solute-binding protein [Thermoleophilaceae bacterium]|nr:extracellular solute-binding protein [Thermoleophilaceae bacterium]
MRVGRVVVFGAVLAATALAGCGSGGGGGGTPTLNWYVFKEPGGAYDQAVANCNKQAGGRYKIVYQALPTDANQQRELLVRRLAAKDSSVDLVGADVIWTAEFAQAGWIKPWTGANRAAAVKDRLVGPLKTVQYRGGVWAAPFTSNTQLLWYRKDLVPNPGENATWDQIIDTAIKKGKSIEVQGNQYEGLTVWINALVEGAGTPMVSQTGKVTASDKAIEDAARIVRRLATTKAAPAGLGTNKEDEARLGFESGRSVYQLNYTFIYPSAAEVTTPKDFQKRIGWARYPRTVADKPSRPPLGGINVAVGNYTKHEDVAFRAALCLSQPKNQAIASEKGGLPPTSEAVYNDAKVKKAFPFADELRRSIEEAGPRPVTPAYSDISLAIQKTFHPESEVQPSDVVSKLQDRLDKAAEGKIF